MNQTKRNKPPHTNKIMPQNFSSGIWVRHLATSPMSTFTSAPMAHNLLGRGLNGCARLRCRAPGFLLEVVTRTEFDLSSKCSVIIGTNFAKVCFVYERTTNPHMHHTFLRKTTSLSVKVVSRHCVELPGFEKQFMNPTPAQHNTTVALTTKIHEHTCTWKHVSTFYLFRR